MKLDAELPQISPEGDCAVRVQFGNKIDPLINQKVHAFCQSVKEAAIAGVSETVSAYATATVYYNPQIIGYEPLRERLQALTISNSITAQPQPASLLEIPVAYGGEWGPDLDDIAARSGLSEDEVIARHAGQTYLCYMIGFMPGFPYLGEVAPEIQTPRKATPRVRVPAGSIGIAGAQAGIYPFETPGGWNLIGRTPLCLFDLTATTPALVRPGEYVRFIPIQEAEFLRLEETVRRAEFIPQRVPYNV